MREVLRESYKWLALNIVGSCHQCYVVAVQTICRSRCLYPRVSHFHILHCWHIVLDHTDYGIGYLTTDHSDHGSTHASK